MNPNPTPWSQHKSPSPPVSLLRASMRRQPKMELKAVALNPKRTPSARMQIPRPSTAPIDDGDGVYFAQYKTNGSERLVMYRSADERAANPERLNLDRRGLTECLFAVSFFKLLSIQSPARESLDCLIAGPVLKSEERVRLLNYQNNQITAISNLGNLPNLIFLDLYNNAIRELSIDLDKVPTLRVLMLGKNHIQQISHLTKLRKLDVLDLHSNCISRIDGSLDALVELRVLNLAGNRLNVIESLEKLQSLTELNARRNVIASVAGLDALPALQRVFLSNNQIPSFTSVDCLFRSKHLAELSLDGNPLAVEDPRNYRRYVVEKLHSTLRHLDLKRVTDTERKTVISDLEKLKEQTKVDDKKKLDLEKRNVAKLQRDDAIRQAARNWHKVRGGDKTWLLEDPVVEPSVKFLVF